MNGVIQGFGLCRECVWLFADSLVEVSNVERKGDSQRITRNRNLGILIAMVVFYCAVHIITTEYIRSARSAGQVLCWLPGTQNQTTDKKVDFLPTHESLGIERHSKGFTWSDLSYTIGKGKQTHRILQDVDGWSRPQQLTAVMVSIRKDVLQYMKLTWVC